MGESALAAPAICRNPTHPHAFALNNAAPRTLRQEGGEALAIAGIGHDARNLVTALKLCAELIAEPGVLAEGHDHYAREIHSLADTAEQLVRRLSRLARGKNHAQLANGEPITDLSSAVQNLRTLLGAVAGPSITLEMTCLACVGQVRLCEESLTRILMNLVRNACDAMPRGGRIRITTQMGYRGSRTGAALEPLIPDSGRATALLAVEDDGPGIPFGLLDRVFDPGFSTRRNGQPWPEAPHHGLGLSIVRQLVEEAGGTVRAVVRPGAGGRFEIELPLTKVTPALPSELRLLDGRASR